MAANENTAPSAMDAKAERRSPPAASQSKRDRKRQALMERLTSMSEKLQREQDLAYRDQLQKIQYEINLVQRFDPYDPKALEIASDLLKEHRQNQGPPVHAENARSLMDMAGIKFPNFVDEIEDLMEIRDFQLTQAKVIITIASHSKKKLQTADTGTNLFLAVPERTRTQSTGIQECTCLQSRDSQARACGFD